MSTSPIPPVLDQDRYAVYQPTAATTDFALGFPLFGEAADVAVYLDGSPLALTTDYTVRSTSNGASLTPAPVTDAYVRLNTAISTGKLEIFGNFRPRRTIQATAPYGTRDFNFAFSLLMAALREMWSKFTRAIKVPVGEADLTIPSTDERAGQVLAFDATGKPTVGGRYADLLASASAATVAAVTAQSAALAAAKSAETAALFDPTAYPTTEQIAAILEGFVPTARKLKVGAGLSLDGSAGSLDGPAEADLSTGRLIKLVLASAATVAEGTDEELPVHSAGVHSAIAAALGALNLGGAVPKAIRDFGASGTYAPTAGTKFILGLLVGGSGGGNSVWNTNGGPGGVGFFFAAVSDAQTYPVAVGGGGGVVANKNSYGGTGGTTSIVIAGVTYYASGGGGAKDGGGNGGTPSATCLFGQAGAAGGWYLAGGVYGYATSITNGVGGRALFMEFGA